MLRVHAVQRVEDDIEGCRKRKTRLVSWYVVVLGMSAAVVLESSRRDSALVDE